MEKIFTQQKKTQTHRNQPSDKTVQAILAYASATTVIRSNDAVFSVSNN